MTWVKVCGLTTREQVAAAEAAGADAIGLVLVPASPRAISEAHAAVLATAAKATAVLLTVDREPDDLVALANRLGADAVQPYGAHAARAADAALQAGLTVLRPVSAAAAESLNVIPGGQIPLVDHRTDELLGGTGETFDWELVADVGRRIVLAGGLHPGNVGEAITRVQPWGVDASSGLESAPGVKDMGLVTSFVEKAKRA